MYLEIITLIYFMFDVRQQLVLQPRKKLGSSKKQQQQQMTCVYHKLLQQSPTILFLRNAFGNDENHRKAHV